MSVRAFVEDACCTALGPVDDLELASCSLVSHIDINRQSVGVETTGLGLEKHSHRIIELQRNVKKSLQWGSSEALL